MGNVEVRCAEADTVSAEGQVILLEDGQLAYIKSKGTIKNTNFSK